MKRFLFIALIISSCTYKKEFNPTTVRFEFTSTDTTYNVWYYKFGSMTSNKMNKENDKQSWSFDTIVTPPVKYLVSGFPKIEGTNTIELKVFVDSKLKHHKSCSSYIGPNCNILVEDEVR